MAKTVVWIYRKSVGWMQNESLIFSRKRLKSLNKASYDE